MPFAVLNILSASCRQCNIDPVFLEVFVWLGYISSGINPMVYNAFNDKFRRTYKNILTLKFDAIWMKLKKAVNNFLLLFKFGQLFESSIYSNF